MIVKRLRTRGAKLLYRMLFVLRLVSTINQFELNISFVYKFYIQIIF
jgi:hypothetical protein